VDKACHTQWTGSTSEARTEPGLEVPEGACEERGTTIRCGGAFLSQGAASQITRHVAYPLTTVAHRALRGITCPNYGETREMKQYPSPAEVAAAQTKETRLRDIERLLAGAMEGHDPSQPFTFTRGESADLEAALAIARGAVT
jgi:hypothetical protein